MDSSIKKENVSENWKASRFVLDLTRVTKYSSCRDLMVRKPDCEISHPLTSTEYLERSELPMTPDFGWIVPLMFFHKEEVDIKTDEDW